MFVITNLKQSHAAVLQKLTVAQLVNKFPAIYEKFSVPIKITAGPYPEPDESSLHPHYFCKIHFNILPSMPRSPKQSSLQLTQLHIKNFSSTLSHNF
jgi:hypothetical protein